MEYSVCYKVTNRNINCGAVAKQNRVNTYLVSVFPKGS